MDDGRIDWRRLIYSINRQLIGKISRRADAKDAVRCLIIDDTDLPKRGMKAESLGKVFSHTAMKSILGFKAMFLCYTDGKTQFMLDSTIQAEPGKRTPFLRDWGQKYQNRQFSHLRFPPEAQQELQVFKNQAFAIFFFSQTENLTIFDHNLYKDTKNETSYGSLISNGIWPIFRTIHHLMHLQHHQQTHQQTV